MTTWTATITGRVTTKKNKPRLVHTAKRGTLRIPSKAHADWHKDAGYQIALHRPAQAISGPFMAAIRVERPNRLYWSDLDGQLTSWLDLLQDMHVIENDKDCIDLRATVIDGTEHRTTITITTEDTTP